MKMRMFRHFLILLTGVLIPWSAISSASAKTRSEIKAWLDNQVAHSYVHGTGECVPFVKDYLAEFWGISGVSAACAKDFPCPPGWSDIDIQGNANNYQMGDIIVEDWGDSVGHVAVYYGVEDGNHYVVDQNAKVDGSIRRYANKHKWWDPISSVTHCYRAVAEIRGSAMSTGYDRALPDGDYIIAAAANPLYFLDIAGGGTANNEDNVQLYNASNLNDIASHDVWTITYNSSDKFYTIKQKGTNMCLDVYRSETKEEINVQVCSANGNPAQKWAIEYNGSNGYRLRPKCSGAGTYPMCLDISGGSIARETNVWQFRINNSSAQSWLFIPYKPSQPIAEGRYILLWTGATGIELDISGDSSSVPNNTNVQVWSDAADSKYNSFDFIKLSNGYYKVKNAASGKCLNVTGGSPVQKTNVGVYDDNGSIAQQWAVVKNGSGYSLISRCNGYALDLAEGKTANGSNVEVYPVLNNANQRWSFVQAEYTVSFNANGGSGAPSSQKKYYKTNLTLSSTKPTRTGYTFQGWATTDTATSAAYQPGSSYTQDKAVTLYAVWKTNATYTVSYNSNSTDTVSNMPGNQTKIHGTDLTLSKNKPTRTGYTFQGWATSDTATSPEYQPGGSYTQNKAVTLYAVWKSNDTEPPVITGGNLEMKSATLCRFSLRASDNVAVDHVDIHTFYGDWTREGDTIYKGICSGDTWYYDVPNDLSSDKVRKIDARVYDAAGNQALTSSGAPAIWARIKYDHVTFDAVGGSCSETSRDVIYSSLGIAGHSTSYHTTYSFLKALPVPTRTGYTFEGWYTAASGGTQITSSTKVTTASNHTIYAHWTPNTYTVSYNANGGSVSPTSNTVTYGGTLGTLPTPTRTGYTFDGWFTKVSGGTQCTSSTILTAASNITIYAHWTANPYTVAYDANGGTGAPSSQTKYHDTALTLSSTKPTRTGYTFQGWATSATATSAEYQPGGSYKQNKAVTLYAVWKINTYTLFVKVWHCDDKEIIENNDAIMFSVFINGKKVAADVFNYCEQIAINSTYEIKDIKAQTGYQYNAPSKYSAPLSGQMDQDQTIIFDIYYSRYTVSYNANTTDTVSNMPGKQTKIHGMDLTLATNTPTRTGYTFQGWATSTTAINAAYQPGGIYMNDQNVTLYAVWKINTFQVSFDANTMDAVGNMPEDQMKTYGKDLTLSENIPTRTGYNFQGWATTSTGTVPEYQPGGTYEKNTGVMLYACWAFIEPDFVLSSALKTIEAEAFAGGAFQYAYLPEGTASIGGKAFADCPNLIYIYIPESCTSISKDAFSGVTGLTIFGQDGSYAEFYAGKNGFTFVAK